MFPLEVSDIAHVHYFQTNILKTRAAFALIAVYLSDVKNGFCVKVSNNSNLTGNAGKRDAIISRRLESEPAEVLKEREFESFRRMVLREAELNVARTRYRTLKRDLRARESDLEQINRIRKSEIACIKQEIEEIEATTPRHLLKSE